MQLDIDRYRHFVDCFDIPEEQKLALLGQVWMIMGSFVDRAFGLSPEQICLGIAARERANPARDRLDSTISKPFNDAASWNAAEKSSR